MDQLQQFLEHLLVWDTLLNDLDTPALTFTALLHGGCLNLQFTDEKREIQGS